MRLTLMLLFILSLIAGQALADSIKLTGPDRDTLIEDRSYTIEWDARGLESVNIVVHGQKTAIGDESRGDFNIVIVESIPANAGKVTWTVPWIDSIEMYVKAKGYDASGIATASNERGYRFRPAHLARRTANGIYLDLHDRDNQRLYFQKNGRIIHAYMSTSSRNYMWLPRNRHLKVPHDHAGVFRVLEKIPNHWSRLFQVPMPYAMRYFGGHFIHATSENQYGYLGQPASSGCNRLTLTDAKELYSTTPIGTRVEVIGPGG